MPLYVRAGAIIPVDPVRQYAAEKVDRPSLIAIYPGADGSYVMYDDDGASLDYKRDIATWTRFRWNERSQTLRIEPDPRSKSKFVGERKFEVSIAPQGRSKMVTYSNRPTEVSFR
jgi:alpha-glucosidase/alpha-D-xyloside xylohydrolase